MEPDPGGPKTCGSGGSGSGTLMLRMYQSQMRMLSMFEGTALLKIRLSIRVRNFAAPNEPLNIFDKKKLF